MFIIIHKHILCSLVKVCPHAGGVGLCEMVQHLQMWDYVALSGTSEGKWVEYIDQQHEHFVYPTIIENAHYLAPRVNIINIVSQLPLREFYILGTRIQHRTEKRCS